MQLDAHVDHGRSRADSEAMLHVFEPQTLLIAESMRVKLSPRARVHHGRPLHLQRQNVVH
jgi:hypothetical protein